MKTPLHTKVLDYTEPQRVKQMGLYPYFRPIESELDTEVIINGKKVLMFGSNSYLGLTNHPKVKEAARKAVEKYGSGCAGSRFLNGTFSIHLELEEKLAEFVGKGAALVFSTGFQTNLGVISCLPGRNDYLLVDESAHASIIDGTRLSFARMIKFRHNNMNSLEEKLNLTGNDNIKLIIVDGIFSMEGDIAKLSEIVELAKKYHANIIVDDAHGIGVLGERGQGTCSHFGLTDEVDIIVGTFSKSLASLGGFVASSEEIISYIKHHARSLIFSASVTPASAASVLAALEIIKSEPERIKQLWDNTRYAVAQLKDAGLDAGDGQTPIIPIYIRDDFKTFRFTRELLDEGVFVNPIISPAVKSDSALVRFSLMATHTREQIDKAVDKVYKVAKKIDILTKEEVKMQNGKWVPVLTCAQSLHNMSHSLHAMTNTVHNFAQSFQHIVEQHITTLFR